MKLEELKNKWPILRTVCLEHGPGWYEIIDRIMAAITEEGFDPERDEIRQIKEKFGTLRVYIACDAYVQNNNTPETASEVGRWKRISKAILSTDNSASTCEECGQPGRLLVSAGWWSTRCAEHAPQGAVPAAEYFALRELKNRNLGKDQ